MGQEVNDIINQRHNNLTELFRNFRDLQDSIVEERVVRVDKVRQAYIEHLKRIKGINKETSFLFNPLRFFNIGETQHSFLIAKLLDPNAEHGQGDVFLRKFLSLSNIDFEDNHRWLVTAETGRIDILIRRIFPDSDSVIIIENKSNYAVDQENQIYRYWLQEMFLPNQDKEVFYTLTNKEKYRLIYLSPSNIKSPDPISLRKPDWHWLGEKHKELPPSLNLEQDIQIMYFNKEISDWLEECLKLIDSKNVRLSEYIQQYLELWIH